MINIYSIIKGDYLQRTRSYSFLITLGITLYAAYSFVPPPSASYTTLNVAGYKGIYNSAWVGHVSAMMTTIMLTLFGFPLVNNGIKKDIQTGVGLVIATTSISNFSYLLSKTISNLLVLLSIISVTFLMSIVMFFIRSSGAPFVIGDFVLPYLLFSFPAMVVVSALATVGEVFFKKKSMLQYVIFFFLFGAVMSNTVGKKVGTAVTFMDPFGVNTMTNSVKDRVNTKYHAQIKAVNLGFTYSAKRAYKTFEWDGVSWNGTFLLSRLAWILFAFALIYLSSFFFHRFDFGEATDKKRKPGKLAILTNSSVFSGYIDVAALPKVEVDYSIIPFIKTELLLLIRKGSVWLWLINGAAWISLFFVPLAAAHLYILSILLFFQVTRLSELTTKEFSARLHYFTWSSYKPLQRMLSAQILAGLILMVVLALPVLFRYAMAGNFYTVFNIINGAFFIVLLAACSGILSGGKKLFEILFFFITYCMIEKLFFADYLGVILQQSSAAAIVVSILNILLIIASFGTRSYQIRNL